MQKTKIFIGVLVLSTILSNLAFAEASHTDAKGEGNAKTTLETGITIEEIQSADFGRLVQFKRHGAYSPFGSHNIGAEDNAYKPSNGYEAYGDVKSLKIKINKPCEELEAISGGDGFVKMSSPGLLTNSAGTSSMNVTDSSEKLKSTSGNSCIQSMGLWLNFDTVVPDGEYSTENPNGKPMGFQFDY